MLFGLVFASVFTALVSGCGGGSSSAVQTPAESTSDLDFTADAGYRINTGGTGGARQPRAGQDDAGTTYLYYEADSGILVSTSTDGLTFSTGATPATYRYHDRFQQMPDGRWRTFLPAMDQASIISMSSADGTNPTADSGTRYSGGPTDNAKFGITEVFPDPVTANKYIMLYIGDILNGNNIRRAISTDGGNTFTHDRDNVLNDLTDTSCGLVKCSGVDQVSVSLPGGKRRLFVMIGGVYIDSYISDTNWDYFTKETGHRATPETFTSIGLTCYSLHDPTIIKLTDGRYRMYVTCRISDTQGSDIGAIVSATTAS